MGRTGQWWAHETLGRARPDMVVFAKGIASGMPMGGIAARPELFSKCTPASLGGTYGGNPIAAAAACATIDAMREEGVLRNAAGASLWAFAEWHVAPQCHSGCANAPRKPDLPPCVFSQSGARSCRSASTPWPRSSHLPSWKSGARGS